MTELLEVGNTTIHLRDRGEGRALVLLHGWGMSTAVFDEMEDVLSEHYRCLSIDLPGHGASPPIAEFSLSTLVPLLSELLQRLQVDSPVLLGWSLGGMLALALAAEPRINSAGLVLIGTTPKFVADGDWPHGLPKLQLRALRRDLQQNFSRTLGSFFKLMFADNPLPASDFARLARRVAGAARLPQSDTVMQGLELLQQADLRAIPAAIDMPTLVIHGGGDRIISHGAGAWLADQLGGELLSLPQVGHAPFLEQPQTVCVEVERFIDGCR